MPQDLSADRTDTAPGCFFDPLVADLPGDAPVVTTRRALGRLALVATEVGSRFEREAIAIEPMAWMLASRSEFGCAAPLDACLTLDGCVRALVVHRLSLGMDADPALLDMLREEEAEDEEGVCGDEGEFVDGSALRGEKPRTGGRALARDGLLGGRGAGQALACLAAIRGRAGGRLFTASVVWSDGSEVVHAYHASIADGAPAIAARLTRRLGSDVSAGAEIVEGFRPDAAFVEAMVSPAIRDMLSLIARDPGSPLAAGLDLNVEQRFAA